MINSKPLVVFTGQGISIADNFDLLCKLKKELPKLFREIPESESKDLDLILKKYRKSQSGETDDDKKLREENHHKLHECILKLTEDQEIVKRGLNTTMQLCILLSEISERRPVFLFTSNVDRMCKFAALRQGATWFFGNSPKGITSLDIILLWIDKIKACQKGFHYFPMNGEPDFLSTGYGGTFFATKPNNKGWRPADQDWFSTTAEGLGPHAESIDSTWKVSKNGYRLLCDLLIGNYGPGERCDGADFFVIGYGAGATHQRCAYPFERTIQGIVDCKIPRLGNWKVTTLEGPSVCWYRKRRFEPFLVEEPEPTCVHRIKEVLEKM